MVTKKYAKELSKVISTNDIIELLDNIKLHSSEIKWDSPSRCNKSMSRGVLWNMFCENYKDDKDYKKEGINYRIIEEFGEYLRNDLKEVKKVKKKVEINFHHQNPLFLK